MKKLTIIAFLILFIPNVDAENEYIVFLRKSELYIETYSLKNEHKIIDLSSKGNVKKHHFYILKAEFDSINHGKANCYILSRTQNGKNCISMISFLINSGEMICYTENEFLLSKIDFFQDDCYNGKKLNPIFEDFTPVVKGFVYATCRGSIYKLLPDLLGTLGYCFYPIIYDPPSDQRNYVGKFGFWGFEFLDMSPNKNYLSCDFLGIKSLFYWGGSGNIYSVYEFNLKDSVGQKIIDGGHNSNYSENSKYILFEKVKQTWGYDKYKSLGYYVYDRSIKEISFFKFCDAACFIRDANDYMPCPYY